MTDIVKRLRHYADQMSPSGLGGSGYALHPDKAAMLRQAADEIEQLRERTMSGYWKGYIDAIRHADNALQCRGDDRLTRYARRDVLKLAGAKLDPFHAVPIPEWPNEAEWIAAQPPLPTTNGE